MTLSPHILQSLLKRCRIPAACVLGMCGAAMLWTGLGIVELFSLQREALAGTALYNHQSVPPSFVPSDKAALLQSAVDSAALSIGSVFAVSPEIFATADTAGQALGSALNNLSFGLGCEVYFTAWQGTKVVHSPLAPDASGLDFADAIDARGAAFVRQIEAVAARGGGFLQATLPRQMAGLPEAYGLGSPIPTVAREGTHEDLDILVGDIVGQQQTAEEEESVTIRADINHEGHDAARLMHMRPKYCPVGERSELSAHAGGVPALSPMPLTTECVEQLVYVQKIPHSRWHLAAFMPREPRIAANVPSAWRLAAGEESAPLDRTYRKGLCVSGFSLAGLAGLLVFPARRREDVESI